MILAGAAIHLGRIMIALHLCYMVRVTLYWHFPSLWCLLFLYFNWIIAFVNIRLLLLLLLLLL